MKIAIILGTRPEIIKNVTNNPRTRRKKNKLLHPITLHTGQHYSYNMDRIFFKQLKSPEPKYNLEVGSGTHAEQTGKMMIGIERVLMKETPDVILVEGDTNTVLAGALAAVKLMIKVGHVEAGLRSFDREMPLQLYLDTITKNLIATSPRSIKKNHYLLIAYTIEDNNIKVTTI